MIGDGEIMINYIVDLNKELIRSLSDSKYKSNTGLDILDFLKVISEEIDKLETLYLLPNDRYDFVIVRENFRKLKAMTNISGVIYPRIIQLSEKLIQILYNYGSIDWQENSRNFDFLHDGDLKSIIERDYRELITILLPDGAWKSVVIMSGSILEAILFDVLTNPIYSSKALISPKAPRNKDKVVQIDSWKLKNLIEVAEDILVLPPQRIKSIDQVLRDYRNFVHPKKEIKSSHQCTEAEALMAKGGLDGVCNHLSKIIN
ncbi:hypothetical protein [Lysinibacillus sp. PWR01]|uniref:hypothetical protein n=1 Tax=Lysinibacillus sp. PWR01 TaxID=3342384 RepID=UPI00372CFAF1